MIISFEYAARCSTALLLPVPYPISTVHSPTRGLSLLPRKRFLFRNSFASVMSFLAVNQMMVEAQRVLWVHGVLRHRNFSVQILVDMCAVTVDHHNHSA